MGKKNVFTGGVLVTENERLDQIFKWVSELHSQVAVLQAQLGALRGDIEALRHPYHPGQNSNQYWSIVVIAAIIAAALAATVFNVGAPR